MLRRDAEVEAVPDRARAGRGRRSAPPALRHGILPTLLGYQLRLAQLAVFRDFELAMRGLGISPGRVGMLVLVEANPGLSQSRLAQAVGLDRSTLVPVLDELERRALLERRSGPDRRTNGLWLTPRGKRFLTGVKRRVAQHERPFLARLSPAEREQLLSLLTRLAA